VRALGGERGVRVLLTRDNDRQVSLMQRAAFANGSGAVVFVSLHVNASPSPISTGPEVASIGGLPPLAAPAEDRSMAVPLAGGGTRRIALVPWEEAQARHADVAAAFASEVGDLLRRVAPLGPRAVHTGALRPLAAVNVPAVLVELGYFSNPEEGKLLAGEMRQVALAQALVDAILVFDWTPPRPAPPAPRPPGAARSGGR
jgi:N-acetylmuramoyl-L-alanine amidase